MGKVFVRSLLHAVYGGAVSGLVTAGNGPLTVKTVGFGVLGGIITGLVHFVSAK